jgi:MFS family permease
MEEMMNQGPKNNRKAVTLLALQFLSDFGDQIANALLALCLLDITNSTAQVGSVYLITTLGYVFFTFVGGVLGDNLSRRKILVSSDVARGFVVLLMIVALSEKSIALIYATSFFLSILDSIHRPVKLSAWTETIPPSKLEKYTSLSELSIQGSTIFGPLIASFFLLLNLKEVGFAFDAMTFFVCAFIFGKIVTDKNKEPVIKREKRDFLKGFKLIGKEPEISKFVAYDAIQMIGFGAFNATFLILAQRDFGWSKSVYSYHLSVVAILTVVGAFLGATDVVAKIEQKAKLTICALLSALTLFAVLKIQTFPMSSILVGICDALTVLTMAVTRTRVQLFAIDHHPQYLSSIIASRGLIIKAATLLGTGACLVIDDFISLENTLVIFVVPIALSCMPFLFGRDRTQISSSHSVTTSDS